jgi:hypothetical protein
MRSGASARRAQPASVRVREAVSRGARFTHQPDGATGMRTARYALLVRERWQRVGGV